ncbi:MAG: toll/interleukin-1 receptor domain-containing protein [Lewinellaceae bacterium]|nr:toll/interleukin-1 receptor domain-containing protein [Lewinellaceae bacterium]
MSNINYDLFISYSHTVDSKLAPALQYVFQKFAKPFGKLKALNVFRDETSLAASPDLWASIEKALANSSYFLLLANPKSAKSKWVRKEIEYWLQNKSIDTLFIALTSGEILWDEDLKDFDWQKTNAIPEILRGKFNGEPLFVDFTSVKSSTDLAYNNPSFKNKIALITAPIHKKKTVEIYLELTLLNTGSL